MKIALTIIFTMLGVASAIARPISCTNYTDQDSLFLFISGGVQVYQHMVPVHRTELFEIPDSVDTITAYHVTNGGVAPLHTTTLTNVSTGNVSVTPDVTALRARVNWDGSALGTLLVLSTTVPYSQSPDMHLDIFMKGFVLGIVFELFGLMLRYIRRVGSDPTD